MEKLLLPETIEKFRELMNFGFYGAKRFTDVNGKDDWGKICSQMDWIETWVNEIENINTSTNNKHRDTINITQFILGIDTIVNASKNLIDYFNIKYNDLYQSNIFKKYYLIDNHWYPYDNLNDFDFFKRIRSSFAIHPIEIYARKEKMYASWVTNTFGGDTFTVFLYHENKEEKDRMVEIKRGELLKFASVWYKKLNNVNEHLETFM